jgi:hypothetical protein
LSKRPILAAVLALLLAKPALAGTIEVQSSELSSFTILPQLTRFGPFEWRGGLELKSTDPGFGGFSSLALSQDGTKLLAVSDRGYWLKAKLEYAGGTLAGVADAELAPILDSKGKLVKGKVRNDAEALAAWEPGHTDGRVIVGFEGRTRAGTFELGARGFNAPFVNLPIPLEIGKGPGNKELEAIARFTEGPFNGRFVAISEENTDANGDIRAWIFGGGSSFGFGIRRHGDFAITDVALLADGDLLTVERSYAAGELPGMAIRRIRAADIAAGRRVAAELLVEARAPIHAIDNMEGIAVSETAGETRVTLISDDNYRRRLQRTLLLQFALLR